MPKPWRLRQQVPDVVPNRIPPRTYVTGTVLVWDSSLVDYGPCFLWRLTERRRRARDGDPPRALPTRRIDDAVRAHPRPPGCSPNAVARGSSPLRSTFLDPILKLKIVPSQALATNGPGLSMSDDRWQVMTVGSEWATGEIVDSVPRLVRPGPIGCDRRMIPRNSARRQECAQRRHVARTRRVTGGPKQLALRPHLVEGRPRLACLRCRA
jgi:hypothetical protein